MTAKEILKTMREEKMISMTPYKKDNNIMFWIVFGNCEMFLKITGIEIEAVKTVGFEKGLEVFKEFKKQGYKKIKLTETLINKLKRTQKELLKQAIFG